MQHKSSLDRAELEIGAILTISGSRLVVGDTLDITSIGECVVSAFGLGRLVIETGSLAFELRPWHKGDGPAPILEGPSSTWTINGIPNHTRSGA